HVGAGEVALGQRRPLVGPLVLLPDDGEGAVVAALPQLRDGVGRREPAPTTTTDLGVLITAPLAQAVPASARRCTDGVEASLASASAPIKRPTSRRATSRNSPMLTRLTMIPRSHVATTLPPTA